MSREEPLGNRPSGAANADSDGECDNRVRNVAREGPSDPRLAALVSAWPTLPEPVRNGIAAMVEAHQ
jgi:hypothetical protein